MNSSFAVITSASSGIGLELAKQFGTHGFELLIASSSDEIFEAQRELEDMGIEVEAIKVNLATFAGVEHLYNRIQKNGKTLNAIAINAGAGDVGEFLETDLRKEISLINLNIVSAIHLLKKVLPEMKLRGEGQVIMTSTTSSNEVLNRATKAFLRSFADSLRHEMKDSGVTLHFLKNAETLFSESLISKLQDYALKILPEKAKTQLHRRSSEPRQLS